MWKLLATTGASLAAGALIATWVPWIGAEARLERLREDITDWRIADAQHRRAIDAMNTIILARDHTITRLANVEGANYEALSKRCAGDVAVWYERGFTVGRNACAVAGDAGVTVGVRDARGSWEAGAYRGR